MPTLNHVHTYIRMKGEKGKEGFYKCNDPICTHTAHKHLIEGKFCLCNKCATQFTLNAYDLKLSRPICINCSGTKEAQDKRKRDDVLDSLFTNTQEIHK